MDITAKQSFILTQIEIDLKRVKMVKGLFGRVLPYKDDLDYDKAQIALNETSQVLEANVVRMILKLQEEQT